MAAEPTADDIAYVSALVREADRPRYYATLFAPTSVRADLFALYGFAAEIAHVPDRVSDPTLGEIRLRWWQEALADALAEAALRRCGRSPAPRPSQAPARLFEAMIEARSADFTRSAGHRGGPRGTHG
jgi:phytoene synthase